MLDLPSVEDQIKFYETQIEEIKKMNLQNEFTRLRNVERLSIAEAENDEDGIMYIKGELKKLAAEEEKSELYIKVATAAIAALQK